MPVRGVALLSQPPLSQLIRRRRITRTIPAPSRPTATAATAILGPVVASEGFVGVVFEAATTVVELGLVPASVLVVVSAAAGADEAAVAVASRVAASVTGGASSAGGVGSAAGVVGVLEGAGAGAETEVSVVGMLLVDGGVPATVGVSGVLLGLYAAKF